MSSEQNSDHQENISEVYTSYSKNSKNDIVFPPVLPESLSTDEED
jgi:hypothetical protein